MPIFIITAKHVLRTAGPCNYRPERHGTRGQSKVVVAFTAVLRCCAESSTRASFPPPCGRLLDLCVILQVLEFGLPRRSPYPYTCHLSPVAATIRRRRFSDAGWKRSSVPPGARPRTRDNKKIPSSCEKLSKGEATCDCRHAVAADRRPLNLPSAHLNLKRCFMQKALVRF